MVRLEGRLRYGQVSPTLLLLGDPCSLSKMDALCQFFFLITRLFREPSP